MARIHRAHPAGSPRGWLLGVLRDPLYRSSYALLVNTAGTTVVGVAYWAVAAHFYTQRELGESAALVSALMLVSLFSQLNLANALPRFIPKAGKSAGKFIARCYAASSGAAFFGSLVFVGLLPRLSSQWQFVRDSLPLAAAFVVAAVVWEVFTLQDIVLLSLRQSVLVPIENFVYGVAKLLMLVGVVSLLPSTGIFLSWVMPLAVTVPAVNWLIFGRYLRNWESAAVPGSLSTREVVRFVSVDYIGSVLAQAYGNLLPLLVLSTLGAAADSSFYIAWTIASGLGLVASNFGLSLLVEGAAAPDRIADLTRGVMARCLAITSLGAAILLLAGHPILEIYGSKYAIHTTSLLGLLAVGTIPSSLVAIAVALDRISGQVGRATLTRLVLTVLVLGGSWILTHKDGLEGVAFAWGGANLVIALARFPTIAAAARRQASEGSARIGGHRPSPKPWTLQIRHPTSRRPSVAGRHRAGGIRATAASGASRPLMPNAVHMRTSAVPPDVAEETARALQLLMSLGKDAGFPS